ncbi:MAG: hypothetical protein R3F18_06265 [Lysobacterales bacterium]|nr:hypothetical protein [Xanthomonadales bacterium]
MTVYHPTDTMPAWLERAWMDRYLDRELDDDERNWFEAYMLDRPQLIEELEADEAVRAAVPSLPSEAADQLLGEAPAPTRTLRSSLRWLPLAAAASITGAVLSAALLQREAVPVETAYAALLDVSRSSADTSPVVLKAGATNVLSIAFPPEVTAAWWVIEGSNRRIPIDIDGTGFGTVVLHSPEVPDLSAELNFNLNGQAHQQKILIPVR